MTVLNIVKIGNPVLRRKCRPLGVRKFKGKALCKFLGSMIETMHGARGVGLAANQVGVSEQVIVLECKANKRYPRAKEFALEAFINPRIVKSSKKLITDWEGCLSIPGYRGLVPRSEKVTFEAVTPYGKRVVRTVEGFHARVMQHEVDHIRGLFYIDRMPDLLSLTHLDEFNRAPRLLRPKP